MMQSQENAGTDEKTDERTGIHYSIRPFKLLPGVQLDQRQKDVMKDINCEIHLM